MSPGEGYHGGRHLNGEIPFIPWEEHHMKLKTTALLGAAALALMAGSASAGDLA